MTTMELERKKNDLYKKISLIDSEEVMNRIEKYINRIFHSELPPCQYTLEELNEHLQEAEDDFRMGRVHTTEDVREYFHKKHHL